MRHERLTLTVTAVAGALIEDCVAAQVALARRLDARVQVEFNGVTVIATPEANVTDLVADYDFAVASHDARLAVVIR